MVLPFAGVASRHSTSAILSLVRQGQCVSSWGRGVAVVASFATYYTSISFQRPRRKRRK
jgi:hypothetical protein